MIAKFIDNETSDLTIEFMPQYDDFGILIIISDIDNQINDRVKIDNDELNQLLKYLKSKVNDLNIAKDG